MVMAYSTGCDCYVDGPEIEQARQQNYPQQCLGNCMAQFLRSVSAGWTDDGAEAWPEGCPKLAGDASKTRLHSLYWCDAMFCGVAINQTGLGQDREYRGPGCDVSG